MEIRKVKNELISQLKNLNEDEILAELDAIFNTILKTKKIEDELNKQYKDALIILQYPLDTIIVIYNNKMYKHTISGKDKSNDKYVNNILYKLRELDIKENMEYVEEGLDKMNINIVQTI